MAAKPKGKAARKPVAKAPAKARAKPARKAPAKAADGGASLASMLDDTPSIPQVFIGIYKGVQRRGAIVYKRDQHHVWTVMLSENGGSRTLHKWGAETFTTNMRPAPVPLNCHNCKVYPLERAIACYLKPGAVFDAGAYRVLTRLSKGQDPDVEDTLDELLDVTPSNVPLRGKRGKRTGIDRMERRRKRAAKFAAMTPAQTKAWREKRNEYRKLRRANKAKAAGRMK